jgi:hypothetical protein
VPISPQCKTNRWSIGDSGILNSFNLWHQLFLLLPKLP